MWRTLDGTRMLQGAEADLVRRAVDVMTGRLVAAYRDKAESQPCGIDWFDQWDADQKIWLLEQVTGALLTPQPPLEPAAMWEATMDAIFCEVVESISAEVDAVPTSDKSWRQSVMDAYRCQHGKIPAIDPQEIDITLWRRAATQITDSILGVTVYQKAELLRDTDIERSRRFLMQKGLPEDFLQQIPPLRTPQQTDQSIARIASILRQ